MKKNGVKNIIVMTFIIVATIICSSSVNAEVIRSYDSQITLQKEGKILVKEKIGYDFEEAYKHGIYRYIPVIKTNTDDKKYELGLQVEGVEDELGNPYTYSVSHVNGKTNIKIGDANRTVTGFHTYIISYIVSGAVTYYSDHDELYWNSTGNDWTVPIENVNTTVRLPEGVQMDTVKTVCYTGIAKSTAQDCKIISEQNSTSASTSRLETGNGITIAVSFPKGLVATLEPKLYTPFEDTLLGKVIIGIAFLLLGIGAFIWYIVLPIAIPIKWYLTGRDPAAQNIRVWYDAPKTKGGRSLTPAETGSLIDETVDMKDIFGSLVQLAQRGYFQIVESPKKGEFTFIKKKDWQSDSSLLMFEKKLLDGLFAGKDKCILKGRDLSVEMNEVTSSLYTQVVADGFFKTNPQSTRTLYFAIAGIALFTGNIFLAIVAFIFAKFMPAKTAEGALQASVGRSLKTFLSSQERLIEFSVEKSNLPAGRQVMFEKMLPYAIAFGVEKIWAERFKDITLSQPSWYVGQSNTAFNALYLSSMLHSSVTTFSTSATPTRSSSGFSSGFGGGGFSGGGGGGGGGGSW